MIGVYCSRTKIGGSWARALAREFGDDQVDLYPFVLPESIEFIACWKAPNRLFHSFPKLKVIQSLGAGVDHIFDGDNVVEQAEIARIIDPQLSVDMYEFALVTILADMKNLTLYRDQQKDKLWKERRYSTIPGTVISILGLGVIGSTVATKLSSLGFQVQGWSRSKKTIEGVQCYSGTGGLSEALSATDYLLNLLPLTNETRGFLNQSLFDKMKVGAYLINLGRGPHLVDEDLITALDREQLSGACLDVFHEEPLSKEHAFWDHPKVLITPHIASVTNIETARQQVFENIRRMKSGTALLNVVDKVKGY